MTADQRIEKLLNRVGQTISDLPKGDGSHVIYGIELRKGADIAARDWHGISRDNLVDIIDETRMLEDYILHLTDIIDRMETALENVCGERDYLRSVVCGLCTNFREDGADSCETCIVGEGVPEYWSADDDKTD